MKEIIATDIRLNKMPPSAYRLLTARIEEAVRERIAPAAAVAVFHHDELVLEGTWGWIDPQVKLFPVQASYIFDLASLTKLYTTTAFLSLVSEEKVNLYTPLVEIIPEFGENAPRTIDGGQDPETREMLPANPIYQGKEVDPAQVTFFHLLTHTSGLPAWRDAYKIVPTPVEPPLVDPITREERWQHALQTVCHYPFVDLPDTGVCYSDIGMMLLGEAVSRLHDARGSLDSAIKDRVLKGWSRQTTFNPLYNGYQRHQIVPTENDTIWRKRRIWGEVHDENASAVGGIAGHAGLFAPVVEVAQFGNAWLHHSEAAFAIDPDLAGAATELQAQTGTNLRGLGWMLKPPDNSGVGTQFSTASYGHTGFTGTSLWIDPNSNLVIALATNCVWGGRDRIGIRALRGDVNDLIYSSLVM